MANIVPASSIARLPAKLAARFSARIPRIIDVELKKDPKFLQKLFAKLRASGIPDKALASTGTLVAWIKANPGQSILLVTALSSLGVNVMNIMKDQPSNASEPGHDLNVEEENVLTGIQREGDRAFAAARKEAYSSLVDLASEDDDFESGLDGSQMAKAFAHIEVLRWAQSFFGSKAAAKRAHVMMQAFAEMSVQDVERGFEIYNLQGR